MQETANQLLPLTQEAFQLFGTALTWGGVLFIALIFKSALIKGSARAWALFIESLDEEGQRRCLRYLTGRETTIKELVADHVRAQKKR